MISQQFMCILFLFVVISEYLKCHSSFVETYFSDCTSAQDLLSVYHPCRLYARSVSYDVNNVCLTWLIGRYADRIANAKWEVKELGMEHNGYTCFALTF